MKAYELRSGTDFAALTLVERAPAALGPLDVRVRIHAISLNFRDLATVRNDKRRQPLVPVSDGAGEVIAVGEGVTRQRVGDRVVGAFFPTWLSGPFLEHHHANALGGSLDGMLREEVVLLEDAWLPIPAWLSFEQAATLPCAGVTAWHALFEAASLKPGDQLLIQGTGGVSLFALQLARAAGARVIATSSSPEKRERLTQMCALTTIDYRANPKWGEAARAASGGAGVDLVVEVGGPGTFDQSVKALRFGGTMSILGVLTGTQGPVDTYAIFHKNIRVHGVYVGSVAMFGDLLRALEAAHIEPIVDRTFSFGEVRAAYEYLASGRHFGKVVVRVG